MSFSVRKYTENDFLALYKVCLLTGNAGNDASHLYSDKKLLGHVYVGPYVVCYPDLTFVLEDEQGICGYVLGSLDTVFFHAYLANNWYPHVQQLYRESTPPPQNNNPYTAHDKLLLAMIKNPQYFFPQALHAYPSELHIDIIARAQGKGQGRVLMETLLQALQRKRSRGVHLGLHKDNTRAKLFYEKLGFRVAPGVIGDPNTVYMIKELL